MKQHKKAATIIGVLFLIALILNIVANEISKPVLDRTVYLTNAYSHRYLIVVVNLLNITCAIAMIFIPLVLLSAVRYQHKPLAIAYIGFRGLEGILFLFIAVKTLSFIDFSKMFLVNDTRHDIAAATGNMVIAEIHWATIIYLIIYSCGALVFYYLLLKSRLVPQGLSIWGLVAVLLLVSGTIMAIFGLGIFNTIPLMQGMVWFAPPIALNELVLAVWLIIKGFNLPHKREPAGILPIR